MTSACQAYLHSGRQKSSAYKLSDAGYDVWLPNARGNTYSRRHIALNPDDPRFWDFSWHEIGVLDLPAVIDYILMQTNQTKLAYVGHSQGVTALFVLLSELPEYNDKISIAHVMTPPVIFKYNHPLVPRSIDEVNSVANFLQFSGMYELAAHKNMNLVQAVARMCMTPNGARLCRSFVFGLFGPSKEYYDGFLMNVMNHIPAGASYKQFVHYGQIASSGKFFFLFHIFIEYFFYKNAFISIGKFQRYHHGIENNMRIYNSPNPPEYNLTNVRAKIHLMYGTNDWLTPSEVSKSTISPNRTFFIIFFFFQTFRTFQCF